MLISSFLSRLVVLVLNKISLELWRFILNSVICLSFDFNVEFAGNVTEDVTKRTNICPKNELFFFCKLNDLLQPSDKVLK